MQTRLVSYVVNLDDARTQHLLKACWSSISASAAWSRSRAHGIGRTRDDGHLAGNQAFTFVGTTPFGQAGEIGILISGGVTYVVAETNGPLRQLIDQIDPSRRAALAGVLEAKQDLTDRPHSRK